MAEGGVRIESEELKKGHISQIVLVNWGIWSETQTLRFQPEPTKNCFCFIGESNTGKSLLMESISVASTILWKLPRAEEMDLAIRDETIRISLNQRNQKGMFAIKCSAELPFYYGLFSYANEETEKPKWTWEPGCTSSLCFVLHGTDIYIVKNASSESRKNKGTSTAEGYSLKKVPLSGLVSCVETVSDLDAETIQQIIVKADYEEGTEIFLMKDRVAWPQHDMQNDLVRELATILESKLPLIYVHEDQNAAIYSGRFSVGESFTNNLTYVTDTSGLTFYHYQIPSGLKFREFALNIMSKMTSDGSPKCLILDEPTRCMHPVLIRDFMHELMERAEKQHVQVIITTHSPETCRLVPLKNVFMFKRNPRKIKCAGEALEIDEMNMASFYECLFAGACILVEGPDDHKVLSAYLERAKTTEDTEYLRHVMVFQVQGKKGLCKVSKWLENLEIQVAFIVDGDAIFGGAAKDMPQKLELKGEELFNSMMKEGGLVRIKEAIWEKLVKISRSELCPEDVWNKAKESGIHAWSRKLNCDLEGAYGFRKGEHSGIGKRTKAELLRDMPEELKELIKDIIKNESEMFDELQRLSDEAK